MTRNPNLVPTPITDKNGKQTTVLRKPATVGSAARIPMPASAEIAAKRAEENELRKSIPYDLGFIDTDYITTREEERVVETLAPMLIDELRRLAAATKMVNELDADTMVRTGEVSPDAASALLSAIEQRNQKRIDIIIEHGPKLHGHLCMRDLVAIAEKIYAMNNPRINFSDNMDAHIEAAGKITSINAPGIPDYYPLDEKFIRFINKHPDKVDEALAFREQFHLKTYDDEAFAEFLAAGAVRDGML